jgi:hypothetical protein
MDCKVRKLLDSTMNKVLKTNIQTILSTLIWYLYNFATRKLFDSKIINNVKTKRSKTKSIKFTLDTCQILQLQNHKWEIYCYNVKTKV